MDITLTYNKQCSPNKDSCGLKIVITSGIELINDRFTAVLKAKLYDCYNKEIDEDGKLFHYQWYESNDRIQYKKVANGKYLVPNIFYIAGKSSLRVDVTCRRYF